MSKKLNVKICFIIWEKTLIPSKTFVTNNVIEKSIIITHIALWLIEIIGIITLLIMRPIITPKIIFTQLIRPSIKKKKNELIEYTQHLYKGKIDIIYSIKIIIFISSITFLTIKKCIIMWIMYAIISCIISTKNLKEDFIPWLYGYAQYINIISIKKMKALNLTSRIILNYEELMEIRKNKPKQNS